MNLKEIFNNDVMVCLSAGHGGVINGKYVTSPSKMETFNKGKPNEFTFYEGVFNRQVVLNIIKYLHEWKISYEFINFTHEDIHPRKRGQMCDSALANSKVNYAFGVEIHANYFYKEEVNGFEIYTSPGITPSDSIATEIYEAVDESGLVPMRPGITKSDPDVDKEENFAFLLGGKMPLVLCEVDFFSNEDVARALMDPVYQDKISFAIAKGIKRAVNSKCYAG